MDQLRSFGQWLKKNYFWVVCGFVSLLSLGFWFIATGSLQAEADQRRGVLADKESKAESIRSKPNHPNLLTQARMDERINSLRDDVFTVWSTQYQKQRDILVWPAHLGSEFISKVADLQPIEQKVQFPLKGEEPLNPSLRTIYRDFIYRELPEVAKIIGAKWRGQAQSSPIAAPNDQSELVTWNSSNQQAIFASRFDWSGKANRVPSTLDVLYAQEDLWLLQAVMQIIANTNGDITHRYQAAVKTIEFIDFGRDAMGMAGQVTSLDAKAQQQGGMPGMGGGGMPMPGMGGGAPGMGGSGAPGMGGSGAPGMGGGGMPMPGSTGGSGTGPESDPGDYRYVNLKYEPLTAKQLREAFESNRPDDAFLMVAKRIPVRIRMRVDQRKLPKLLAECGNADLQLEVKQLRINTPSGSTARSGGMGGGMGGGGDGPPGMAGMGGGGPPAMGGGAGATGMAGMAGMTGGGEMGMGMLGGGGPPGMGGGGGAPGMGGMFGGGSQTMSDETPYDVTVELYGIVYFYNPVDREKLGQKLEEASSAEGASQAETPEAAGETPATAEGQTPAAGGAGSGQATSPDAAGSAASGGTAGTPPAGAPPAGPGQAPPAGSAPPATAPQAPPGGPGSAPPGSAPPGAGSPAAGPAGGTTTTTQRTDAPFSTSGAAG